MMGFFCLNNGLMALFLRLLEKPQSHENKKNPQGRFKKKLITLFLIGLCFILFISWRAIEWRTYEKVFFDYQSVNVSDDDDEEIPITEQLTPSAATPTSSSGYNRNRNCRR